MSIEVEHLTKSYKIKNVPLGTTLSNTLLQKNILLQLL